MAALESLKELYEQYDATVVQVRKKASAFAGMFGLGDDPRRNACHESFYDAVGKLVADYAASNPEQEDVAQVVRFILSAAHLNRDKETYWYLYAVQGHTKVLIPMLSAQDCGEMIALYDDAYPKADRMPVQRELYKLLLKHAGQKADSGSFFQKLFGK